MPKKPNLDDLETQVQNLSNTVIEQAQRIAEFEQYVEAYNIAFQELAKAAGCWEEFKDRILERIDIQNAAKSNLMVS